jgi:hypothetical protein
MSEKDLHQYAKDRAQDLFLTAIEDHCPEVLQSLAADLLDTWRRLNLPDLGRPEDLYSLMQDLSHPGAQPIFICSRPDDETLRQLNAAQESLKKWAENYGLENSKWFLSRAGQTLQWWAYRERSADPDDRDPIGRRWIVYVRYYTAERFPPFGFKFRSFNPIADSKKEYRKAAITQFGAELDHYLENKPEHWRHGKRDEDHFIWLAKRLCRKNSISEIARSAKPKRTWKTVQEGIQTVAELLGIEIPPDQRTG